MYSRFRLVRISINLNSSQLNMFREIILPIFRSTRLCVTACGVMHTPRCCRPASKQSTNLYDIYLTLYVQSWTPDDGRKGRPKHVE